MKKRSFHSTIAANGVLSDFPNVKAIRREERNCLKHLINGKAPFATLPTGFVAFSSDKASFGKKAGWNASYNRCDISVH